MPWADEFLVVRRKRDEGSLHGKTNDLTHALWKVTLIVKPGLPSAGANREASA